MTSATDVAAAAAVVNQDTARLLGDKEINQHISAPAPVGPDTYNPLAISKHVDHDYFPTLESRDVSSAADGEKVNEAVVEPEEGKRS